MRRAIKSMIAVTMAAALGVQWAPSDVVALRAAEKVNAATALSQEKASVEEISMDIQTASGRTDTYAREIDGEWLFGGKSLTAADARKADYSTWQKVTIPHTWNALDGEDGGGNYVRAPYWYHKEISVEKELIAPGKKLYIEFLGANQKTDVYVNGKKAGDTHKGGYTAFRYEISELMKEGANTLDVCVDNTYNQDIAPISGDFNMYGGIYRRVYLVSVDDVHVDLENNGSSGLFLETGDMRSKSAPKNLGEFKAKADIVNASDEDRTVDVTVAVEGKNAPAAVTEKITIPAGETYHFSKNCKVENPVLWEGASYEKDADTENVGYQYQVTVTIQDGEEVIDEVSDKIGFRYFWIDSKNNGEDGEGFFLNGKKHPLRGVNRHQFLAKVGSAMTEQQHADDMEIIKEIGANAVRLCHYPQTDYFYDLCDANGIIVWTEIPTVNEVRDTEEFKKTTKQQLTELISQQYNRPSVCFWGIENEIGNGASLTNATANKNLASAKKLLYELDGLAKELDTTGRYTTQAVNRDYSMDNNNPDSVNKDFESNVGWKSDIVAWNIYPGWYPDANFYGTFDDVMKRKTALDSRSMGISEYGWGANVNQHEAYPELGVNDLTSGGKNHPEEYQNLMNEEALEYINNHDELWGTFYWALFDFAVDSRNEGSQVALNDKGLVTADRKTKKDSFYLYKANWNKKDSFTYITSRRWIQRDNASAYIKAYSNCDEVELFLNGESLGKMEAKGNGVFLLENVNLPFGDMEVKTVGTVKGDTAVYTDSCTWTRNLSKKAELESEKFPIDNTSKTLIVENNVSLKNFREEVKGVNNAQYKVYDGENEITADDTVIVPGMKIHVVAEDGETEADFTVVSSNLCVNKAVKVSTVQDGNDAEHAVDGNSSTKWVASSGSYPQDITVDLGAAYYVDNLAVDWDYRGGARYYGYTISVSEDGKQFSEIVNQKQNTNAKTNVDSLMLTKARYIKVTALSCNQAGWASVFEMRANGYRLESDCYTVDEEHQLIIVDDFPETGLAEGTFANYIQVSGNYDYRINLSSGWIKEGNTVDILDGDKNVVTSWVICSEETKENYYKEVEAEKVTLNEASKTLALNGTFTLKSMVLPMTATDKTVIYSSSDSAVATVSQDGVVTAKKVGKAVITAKSANGKTAECQIIVKDYTGIKPVVSLPFDDDSEVNLYQDAKITKDPDDSGNQVLLIDSAAGGANGNYAVAKADLSKYDFSDGVTVSLKIRPNANSSDWNYLFAIGQTKSSGSFNYCDGTVGFITRHGDPYEAHFPGDGWADGNNVNSDYQYFCSEEHAGRWYRLTYVYSASETCIYLDGRLICRWGESDSISRVLKALNKGQLILGAGASENELENFGGYLDDVYVYNEALDASAIPYIGTVSAEAPEQPDAPSKPQTPQTSGQPQQSQNPQRGTSGNEITDRVKSKNAAALNRSIKVTQAGSKLKVKWGKVSGADGYLVYVQYASGKAPKTPIVVKGGKKTNVTVKKLAGKKIHTAKIFKVKVAAYKTVSGKKTVLGKSMSCYVAGAKNKKYTNIKTVKVNKTTCRLKKGKSVKLKVSLKKADRKKKNLPAAYGRKVTFSSSDSGVASVSKSGVIRAKKTGTCVISIYTRNGLAKKITVKVK